MSRNYDQCDFALDFFRKAKEIDRKYKVSAEAHFAINCEIAGVAFILCADDADYAKFDEELNDVANNHAVARLLAKGTLAQLKDKGVTQENAQEYIEARIAEFEAAARCRRQSL